MGMYDNIKCKMPLPGEPLTVLSPSGTFQTKSLECEMASFEITEDGRLLQVRKAFGGEVDGYADFTGEIEFYNDNAVAAAYGMCFTRSGEDLESAEYKATFVNGVVTEIIQIEYERKIALAYSQMSHSEIEIAEPVFDLTNPKIGAKMFLQYGGGSKGFPVTLRIKTKKKWGFVTANGDIETVWPSDFGRLLFHTEEDAQKWRAHRDGTWDAQTERAKNLLAEKIATSSGNKNVVPQEEIV